MRTGADRGAEFAFVVMICVLIGAVALAAFVFGP